MNLEDLSQQSTLPTGVVLPPHHDEVMAWIDQHLRDRLEGSWVDCEPPQNHVDSCAVPLGGQYSSSHEPSHYGDQFKEPIASTSCDYPSPPQTTTYYPGLADDNCFYPPPTYSDFDGSSVTPPMALSSGDHSEFVAGPSCLPDCTTAAASSATSPPILSPTTQGAAYFTATVLDPHPTRFQLLPPVSDQLAISPTTYTNPNYDDNTFRYRRGTSQIELDMGGPHSATSSSSSGRVAGLKRKSADADLEQGGRELKMRRREMTRMDDEAHPSLSGIQGGVFAAGSQPGVRHALQHNIHKSKVRHHEESILVSAPYPNAVQTLGEGPSVQRGATAHSVCAEEPATAGEVGEEGEEEVEVDEDEEEVEGGEVRRWACPSCKKKDGRPKDFGREADLARHFKTVKAHKQGPGFECPHPPCAKSYTRSDTLRNHIRKKHPDELDTEA